jgi:hypothetical protein
VRLLAPILAVLALVAAGCNGSDSSSSAAGQPGPAQETTPQVQPAGGGKHFTKAQLPKLALQPGDAPPGMRYTRAASGRMSLDDVGFILPKQIADVRALNLKGIYDSTFDAKSGDLRLASRLWLFGDADGAEHWLDKTESDSQQYGFEPLTSPDLGDDSWAARGNLAAEVVTYAFRMGNLVVVTSYTTQGAQLSESAALAAAQKAAQRVAKAA